MARKDRSGDGVHTRGTFLFIFASQYWLTNFVCRQFFPPSNSDHHFSVSFLVTPTPTMNTTRPAQVRCPGCEKDFTPRGLSQHVTRTQDLRCRRVVAMSQTQLLSTAFPRMGSPPTLSSTWVSQVAGEDTMGDEYNESTQGEFAVTHAAHAAPYENFVVDELDYNGTPVETPDPADIADADAFEELAPNGPFFTMTTLDQPAIDESPDMPDAPEQPPNGMGAGSAEGMPTVVIDRFPSASAGAPMDNIPRRNSVYESQQGADGDAIWSPFTSQCDWLFARWAKMRGSTSSAVADLLAIPEVRPFLYV